MKFENFFFLLIVITFGVSKSQSECGTHKALRSIIIGGNSTVRGEQPWKAALINEDGEFICGGNLVSNKAVVTAAQCIKQKGDSSDIKNEDLSVVLGAQDLSKSFERGRLTVGVKSVHVHPDYNVESDSYDGDIALLVLDTEVQFSATIQPVCLSKPQSLSLQETEGIVVGYQKVEGENNAKKTLVPIKGYHSCVRGNDNLKSYLSARTICGGSGDESGDFEAASGSGLYIFHNNRFYLRGTTSASSLNKKLYSVNTYGIFVDTAEYCGWIQSGGINKYAQCTENDFSTTTQLITTQQTTTTSQPTTQPITIATTTEKPTRNTLESGECLVVDDFLLSSNKCFKVLYQGDGNLVTYRTSSMQHIWHTVTHGTCTNYACMQTDGNFVVYDCNRVAKWDSHSPGHPGARIVIQDDGNLVVYSTNNVPLWNSQTVTHC